MISPCYEVFGQASRQDGGRDEGGRQSGVGGHCVDRFSATFKSKWVGENDKTLWWCRWTSWWPSSTLCTGDVSPAVASGRSPSAACTSRPASAENHDISKGLLRCEYDTKSPPNVVNCQKFKNSDFFVKEILQKTRPKPAG